MHNPTPEVVTTGYAVLQKFDKDLVEGDGLNEANKLIRDLKGDSEDVFFGVFPDGVKYGVFQGQSTHGVASGMAHEVVVAHEIGHVFGRAHAPCTVPSACDNPANPDDDYPQYGSYAPHSIGEFGFDPRETDTGEMVKRPAEKFDFMGYARENHWVSPYTYLALMVPGGPRPGGIAAEGGSGNGVWRALKRMVLFLDITIDQARHVRREVSFHFPALSSERPGRPSPFRAELWDECHRVLVCRPLSEDPCLCFRDCCSYSFFSRLPMPPGARWLVILEGGQQIYEECIPDPPDMFIDCSYEEEHDRFRVHWLAQEPGVDERDIWYLVQWQDIDGTWRALMPRTRERSAVVAPELLGRRREMRLRVLASAGIATGRIECRLTLPERRPAIASVSIVAEADGAATAYLTDHAGRSLPEPDFVWFDEKGRSIGRGRRLNPRARRGVGAVRVVATRYVSRIGRGSHARLSAGEITAPRPDYPDV